MLLPILIMATRMYLSKCDDGHIVHVRMLVSESCFSRPRSRRPLARRGGRSALNMDWWPRNIASSLLLACSNCAWFGPLKGFTLGARPQCLMHVLLLLPVSVPSYKLMIGHLSKTIITLLLCMLATQTTSLPVSDACLSDFNDEQSWECQN